MHDVRGQVIYVGKAKNLKKRVSSYFQNKAHDPKTEQLVANIDHIEVTITDTEIEAYLLENSLIHKLKPRYNIIFRDDKSYPYLVITTGHRFPQVTVVRGRHKLQGEYFGPYPSARAVRESLELLQRIFKLRQCDDTYFKNRSRPCLQYQIKRCTAPCVDYISHEDYHQDMQYVRFFLQGKMQHLFDDLVKNMEAESEKHSFEQAAKIRDQISALRQIQQHQIVIEPKYSKDIDVLGLVIHNQQSCVHLLCIRSGRIIGTKQFHPKRQEEISTPSNTLRAFITQYYLNQIQAESTQLPKEIVVSHPIEELSSVQEMLRSQFNQATTITYPRSGLKAKWIEMACSSAEHALLHKGLSEVEVKAKFKVLQEALQLSQPIFQIECFDISHIQGKQTIGACVVFNTQGAAKHEYRRYNIKLAKGGDDYAAMHEALSRYFKKEQGLNQTNQHVLIIDGGKGQMKQAIEVLKEFEIHNRLIIAMSKGRERTPGKEKLFLADGVQLNLSSTSPGFYLLQQVRDEAHRFAITGHRKQRGKKVSRSPLEDIPGIGKQKRQNMLRYFGGLQEIQRASVVELARVPGISKGLAQKIYDALHGQ